MIGIGISPMRMNCRRVAGTVSRVNPSGVRVNASSPADSPVAPAEARGRSAPPREEGEPVGDLHTHRHGVCANGETIREKRPRGGVQRLRVRRWCQGDQYLTANREASTMMFSRNKTPATTWNASMVINGSLRRNGSRKALSNRRAGQERESARWCLRPGPRFR